MTEEFESETDRLRERLTWILKDIEQADSMEKFLWLAVELSVELQEDYEIRQNDPIFGALAGVVTAALGAAHKMSKEPSLGSWDSELPEVKKFALMPVEDAQQCL